MDHLLQQWLEVTALVAAVVPVQVVDTAVSPGVPARLVKDLLVVVPQETIRVQAVAVLAVLVLLELALVAVMAARE